MDKKAILKKANDNLKKIFGAKKHKRITFKDIDAVYSRNIFAVEQDAKTRKGSKNGYLTGVMYLAPSDVSSINTCPAASAGCKAACLFTAGRGVMYPVFRQRIVKTLAFYFDRPRFIETVKKSIKSVVTKAKNKGMTPVIRLNGTSDIMWDKITDIMQVYSDTQFYDYTKIWQRFTLDRPSNYHLTFSFSESNADQVQKVLTLGGNVATVFRNDLPSEFLGYKVIDGDATDLRFLDGSGDNGQGLIVGLKAKGKAKNDASGFVKDVSKSESKTKAA